MKGAIAFFPLAALLLLSRPADAAAPGALEGTGLICSALLDSVAREPSSVETLKDEAFPTIEQILRLRGYDFGEGRARGMALVQAAYIAALARQPAAEVQLRGIRDTCVDAVLTGRLTLDPV